MRCCNRHSPLSGSTTWRLRHTVTGMLNLHSARRWCDYWFMTGEVIASLLLVIVVAGCTPNRALMKASLANTRSDVFQELRDGGAPPAGYVDLRIVSSLKTHAPDLYPSEMKTHGTPDYKLLLNIDGQAIWLAGSLKQENTEPSGIEDPEAGEGIRYRLRKDLRLAAGRHRVIVAVPEDGVIIDRTVTLREGMVNELVLQPIYGIRKVRGRPTTYSETSFLEGLRGFAVVLNGKPI